MSLAHLDGTTKTKLLNTTLTTYSPTGRARNVIFSVAALSSAGIVFRKQNGKEQMARREEMDFVSDHWSAIKSGEITRKTIAKNSFNTSYLFSVLHFIDTHSA